MGVSVYTATNRESGQQYVGVSKDPVRRWARHVRDARVGSPFRFHRALHKHGAEAFDFQVVAELPTDAEAKIAERVLIALMKPEYNLTAGGGGCSGLSRPDVAEINRRPEKRKAVSDAQRGRPKSAEHVEKLRQLHTGRKRSPETCKRIGQAKLGMKHSDETRAKMSKAHAGRTMSAESREKISANWFSPARLASLAKRRSSQ